MSVSVETAHVAPPAAEPASVAPDEPVAPAPGEPVRVALLGLPESSAGALQRALAELPGSSAYDWRVSEASTADRPAVVICASAEHVRQAGRRWPGADRIARLGGRADSTAVLAALDAGAAACVRDDDAAVLAAHVVSVARRRGFAREGGAR